MKIEIEKRKENKEFGAKKYYSLTSLDLFSSSFFYLTCIHFQRNHYGSHTRYGMPNKRPL